jgi:hypothetical protein
LFELTFYNPETGEGITVNGVGGENGYNIITTDAEGQTSREVVSELSQDLLDNVNELISQNETRPITDQ